MNKKGFTLVELIAVVVIISLVAIIATPPIIEMVNNGKKEQIIADAKKFVGEVKYKSKLIEFENYYPEKTNGSCNEICLDSSIFSVISSDPDNNKYDITESCVKVIYENNKYIYYVKLASKDDKGYVRGISTSKEGISYVLESNLNKDTSVRFNKLVEDTIDETTCNRIQGDIETELVYKQSINPNQIVNLETSTVGYSESITEDNNGYSLATDVNNGKDYYYSATAPKINEETGDYYFENGITTNLSKSGSLLANKYVMESSTRVILLGTYDTGTANEFLYEGPTKIYSISKNGVLKYSSTSFIFNEKTGMYTLTNPQKRLYSDSNSIYTCDSDTATSCKTMYKRVEYIGNNITKADIYTSKY